MPKLSDYQPSGILLLDKPEGLTSAAVVARIKHRFGFGKVGHGGTLDPLATGLLPLGINEGTKLLAWLSENQKCYQAILKLGESTDTLDRDGKILRNSEVLCSEDEVRRTIMSYVGDLDQVPPMVSAKKHQGQPLYKLARKGQELDLVPVRVTVHDIQIEAVVLPRVRFTVMASKGFYVRALCRDIGESLGCGAHMESLRRLRHGGFALDDATALDDILKMDIDQGLACMVPLESPRLPLPLLPVCFDVEDALRNGRIINAQQAQQWLKNATGFGPGLYRILGRDGKLVAIADLLAASETWSAMQESAEVLVTRRGFA